MNTLTIFTPTYNRGHLLLRLYQSLCRQTSKDFIWLVIDDGSSDNTGQLIQDWINEKKIQIKYVYKKNGGMHTGHNKAYRLIKTELNVCIDSDDYMPDNAVEKITNIWNDCYHKENLAGIVGLDVDNQGAIVGTKIPKALEKGNLTDLYKKYEVKGDKKIVLKTSIIYQYPLYPEFETEKLVPLGILYLMIGKDYDFVYSNEVFCVVEYQDEGSSNNILKQYKQSPKGFAYARKIQINFSDDFQDNFKSYIHLVSSAIFANDYSLLWKDVNPLISLLAFPFGIILNFWIRIKI